MFRRCVLALGMFAFLIACVIVAEPANAQDGPSSKCANSTKWGMHCDGWVVNIRNDSDFDFRISAGNLRNVTYPAKFLYLWEARKIMEKKETHQAVRGRESIWHGPATLGVRSFS